MQGAVRNVILFGAGASYGSGAVFPSKPPLGNRLFAEMAARGGMAAQIYGIPQLRERFDRNFEEGMESLYAFQENIVRALHREIASLLINYMPSRTNLYVKLLKQIRPDETIISSLNYDMLIEVSAELARRMIGYGLSQSADVIRFLKLHGSINWVLDPSKVALVDCHIYAGVNIDHEVIDLDRSALETFLATETTLMPAMALYKEGKTTPIGRSHIQRQQSMWRYAVTHAEKILVVGVNINALDNHIWGALGRTDAQVIYYAATDRDVVQFNDWIATFESGERALLDRRITLERADFATAMPSILRHLKTL